MKKYTLLFLYLIVITPTTLLASADTTYLTEQLKKTSASNAVYKRVKETSTSSISSEYIVFDYDRTNKLFMKAKSSTPNGKLLNGKCIYYHKNGMKQCEGNYQSNNPSGVWKYWSEDHKDTVIAAFESNGKQTIISNTISARMDSLAKASRPANYDSVKQAQKNSVEADAEFPGGTAAFTRFLGTNIQYPKEALARSISGKTILYFEIDKEGNLCNIKPLTMIGFGLEEEAIRVLKAMPQWSPALQDGKKVRVRRTVPVSFTLPLY